MCFAEISNASATRVGMVDVDFIILVDQIIEPYPNTYTTVIYNQQNDGWKLKYSSTMARAFTKGRNYVDKTDPVASNIGGYLSVIKKGATSQSCVGFVRAITPAMKDYISSDWRRGIPFTQANASTIAKGTLLATFTYDANAKDYRYDSQHVMVYWGPVGNSTTKFWVVDQNYAWSGNPDSGIIKKHKATTFSAGRLTKITKYHVVMY